MLNAFYSEGTLFNIVSIMNLKIAAVSTFFDCATFMSVHVKESIPKAQFLFQNNEVRVRSKYTY